MKRPHLIRIAVSIPLALLLHTTWVQKLRFGGGSCDLMGAVAVSFGLLHGPEVGLGTGLAGGLLMDLLNSRFIGLCALTRGGMGVAAGLLGKRVFKENLLVTGTVGFVAAFGSELLGAVVIRASGVALDVAAFLGTALAVGLLNFVATPLLFYILWRDKVRVDSRDSAVIVE